MDLLNPIYMQGLSPGLEAVKEQRISNIKGMAEERKSSLGHVPEMTFAA